MRNLRIVIKCLLCDSKFSQDIEAQSSLSAATKATVNGLELKLPRRWTYVRVGGVLACKCPNHEPNLQPKESS